MLSRQLLRRVGSSLLRKNGVNYTISNVHGSYSAKQSITSSQTASLQTLVSKYNALFNKALIAEGPKSRPDKQNDMLTAGIIGSMFLIVVGIYLYREHATVYDRPMTGGREEVLPGYTPQPCLQKILQTHPELSAMVQYALDTRVSGLENVLHTIETGTGHDIAKLQIPLRSKQVMNLDLVHKFRNNATSQISPMSVGKWDSLEDIDAEIAKLPAKYIYLSEKISKDATAVCLQELGVLYRVAELLGTYRNTPVLSQTRLLSDGQFVENQKSWLFAAIAFAPSDVDDYNVQVNLLNVEARTNATNTYKVVPFEALKDSDNRGRSKQSKLTANELAAHNIGTAECIMAIYELAIVAEDQADYIAKTCQLLQEYRSMLPQYAMLRFGVPDARVAASTVNKIKHTQDLSSLFVQVPLLHCTSKEAVTQYEEYQRRHPALYHKQHTQQDNLAELARYIVDMQKVLAVRIKDM